MTVHQFRKYLLNQVIAKPTRSLVAAGQRETTLQVEVFSSIASCGMDKIIAHASATFTLLAANASVEHNSGSYLAPMVLERRFPRYFSPE